MLTQSSIRRRVLRGMAKLDTVNPGWFKKINLNNLDVSNFYKCPLGQLFGNYSKGYIRAGYSDIDIKSRELHGFTAMGCSVLEDKLTATWKRAIKKRLAA